MDINDLEERAEEQLSFPADADDVRDAMGDEEVTVSGVEDGEELGTVLDRMEDQEFESPKMLAETVRANVDASLVGRENYTDRGTGSVDTEDDEGEAGENSDESL